MSLEKVRNSRIKRWEIFKLQLGNFGKKTVLEAKASCNIDYNWTLPQRCDPQQHHVGQGGLQEGAGDPRGACPSHHHRLRPHLSHRAAVPEVHRGMSGETILLLEFCFPLITVGQVFFNGTLILVISRMRITFSKLKCSQIRFLQFIY